MSTVESSFPVVGIGASAGGVEALESFFKNVPADSGCAFVVVTHLSPDRPSLLAQLIQRMTTLPVTVAEQGASLAPNTVHVMAPDTTLGIAHGRLQVHRLGAGRRERKPVDIFLSELATDLGEYAVGVILSGGDGDGTMGVKAIKERGGLTLAQIADGDPPRYPGMPQSAISSGMIDLAIPVSEMGGRLKEFSRSIALLDGLASDGRQKEAAQAFADARRDICLILRSQVGHDFSGYKEKTFLRRVQRRMQINHIDQPEAYVARLRQDPGEAVMLFRDLLINVTNFFRDAEAFAILEKTVIPKLFADRGADETVRVWVPGCATGEEVFSIAMLMREHLDTLSAQPKVQIFATDIDESALAVARAGRYPAALLDSVSPERRRRFFAADGGTFALTKEVRELCIFSPHSVIRDPPFSRLDMVSCRNLLIYFGADVQSQVIPTFHYALKPGGYLFLGASENVSQFSELFIAIDKKNRVFQSRDTPGTGPRVPLTVSSMHPINPPSSASRAPSSMAFRQTVEAQVLQAFAPAHVVVNRDGDVIFYSARTGKYLEPMAGAPNRQLLAMARKPLRLELRATLREAMETESRTVREGLLVENDEGRLQLVTVTVEPLNGRVAEERLFLVVFSDVGPVLSREEMSERAARLDDSAVQLERELRDTRERLQSLIEEYETALEELKSSNEELVSVNEELQSTNEELEASKEELQSLNEELHTVNAELSAKVDALDRANSDLHNLFESTRVATIFLDRDLAIRNFTPAMSRLFNVLPSDRGRPLTDLSGRISLPTLADDVAQVLADGETIERSVDLGGSGGHGASGQPAHYLLRLVPYRDSLQAIEGVVLTFVDVTSLTEAQAQQRVLIAELNHRVKNMLAIVIGIAEQAYLTTPDAERFKNRLVERVVSMSKSYELLSRENWTATQIAELVRQQTAPFGHERIDAQGPPLALRPREAMSLGMILHELATNAGKYGALSAKQGRVALAWREEAGQAGNEIVLTWQEQDGPAVRKPKSRGFGLRLIEQETAHSLGGRSDTVFAAAGLAVTLRFPRGRVPQ
jgi:two-component system CheB/CheR fusion protein